MFSARRLCGLALSLPPPVLPGSGSAVGGDGATLSARPTRAPAWFGVIFSLFAADLACQTVARSRAYWWRVSRFPAPGLSPRRRKQRLLLLQPAAVCRPHRRLRDCRRG